MPEDLSHWTARPRPEHKPIEGRYVVLEPLDPVRHTSGLFEASDVPDGDQKFRWLPEYPPETEAAFRGWVEKAAASKDPLFLSSWTRKPVKLPGGRRLCGSTRPTVSSKLAISIGDR